jgi:pyruvate/2-oxoglutarate dehydrogenase complex dihydrolipoamide dehydrogenase (E3) component
VNGANIENPQPSKVRRPKGEGLYNAVVIGGGTAGLVTAAGTAGLGGRVALIERNKMGGDCLNFGCVPSKALISSARLAEMIRHGSRWGLRDCEPDFSFADVFARMRDCRTELAPNDSQERFESLGVDVFRGKARFLSEDSVEVNGDVLRSTHFVIATGSRAAIPKIDGLENARFYTNETIFDEMREKPESIAIIGGGNIGCELGQALNRLGIRVTLLQNGSHLLPKEDADVSAFLEEEFLAEGIQVIKNATISSVTNSEGGVRIEGFTEAGSSSRSGFGIEAAALLIAAGRTPNIEGLDLASANVEADSNGVKANDYLQTSRSHIYAVGDVIGRYRFTHMADAEARVAVRNILMPFQFLRQRMDYSVVPWCTYVDPEIATVGLTESAARKRGMEYDLLVQEIKDVDRAVLERRKKGFAKVLLKKGGDRILGVTIVCDHAGDLLHEFVLAMKCGIGMKKLGATIHAYPTFAELCRKSADKYAKTRLTSGVMSAFQWLYRRGRGD